MSRWAPFFSRRKRMMEALDQDIRDFIERETQDNIDRGLLAEEALTQCRFSDAARRWLGICRRLESSRSCLSAHGYPETMKMRKAPCRGAPRGRPGRPQGPPLPRTFSKQSGGIQRVEEVQAGKTREVPVGGGEGGAMLDGQGGQVRVRDQGTTGLPLGHHRTQDLPMPFARI